MRLLFLFFVMCIFNLSFAIESEGGGSEKDSSSSSASSSDNDSSDSWFDRSYKEIADGAINNPDYGKDISDR